MDDAIEWFLLFFVYEPIAAATFLAIREPFEAALDVVYAGNGGLVWLILWLVSGGVPPVLLALNDHFSR